MSTDTVKKPSRETSFTATGVTLLCAMLLLGGCEAADQFQTGTTTKEPTSPVAGPGGDDDLAGDPSDNDVEAGCTLGLDCPADLMEPLYAFESSEILGTVNMMPGTFIPSRSWELHDAFFYLDELDYAHMVLETDQGLEHYYYDPEPWKRSAVTLCSNYDCNYSLGKVTVTELEWTAGHTAKITLCRQFAGPSDQVCNTLHVDVE